MNEIRGNGGVQHGGRDMATGTVKWFNAEQGHGLIGPDDGSGDVYVHISEVQRSGLRGLNDGQKIAYELARDQRSGKVTAEELRFV
jgi:CspA family cold shock protein